MVVVLRTGMKNFPTQDSLHWALQTPSALLLILPAKFSLLPSPPPALLLILHPYSFFLMLPQFLLLLPLSCVLIVQYLPQIPHLLYSPSSIWALFSTFFLSSSDSMYFCSFSASLILSPYPASVPSSTYLFLSLFSISSFLLFFYPIFFYLSHSFSSLSLFYFNSFLYLFILPFILFSFYSFLVQFPTTPQFPKDMQSFLFTFPSFTFLFSFTYLISYVYLPLPIFPLLAICSWEIDSILNWFPYTFPCLFKL